MPWTGADQVPPMDFGDKLKLSFYEMRGERRVPSASTCAKDLHLPRHCETESELQFFDLMMTALKEGQGFGKI